jgi:hypothetical protein
LFGSMRCLWTDCRGRVELQELNGRSIVKYERNPNSNRRFGRSNQNVSTLERFVQIVYHKGDVRNGPNDLRHATMRLEPDPLDPVGTGLETADMNPKVGDMMLLGARLRVWNSDVVVPPAELRCHGRRLMVQSFSDHAASFINPVHRLRSHARRICRTCALSCAPRP